MKDFNGNLPYALVRAVGLEKNSDNGDARNLEMPDDSMDGIQKHENYTNVNKTYADIARGAALWAITRRGAMVTVI